VKRRIKSIRKPANTKRRNPTAPQRGHSSAAPCRDKPSIRRLEVELERQARELEEARDERAAMAEVLRVISSSPGDLQPVFDAIVSNARRLCGARFGNLVLFDGKDMRVVLMQNASRQHTEMRHRDPIIPLETSILGPLIRTKALVHVADIAAEEPYARSALARAGGMRTALAVPMLKDDELVGAIGIYHDEVRPFTDRQIELLQNFAAQAVIAIENARLLGELRESLEQQTATADVLRAISSSPGALEPVFETMLENAVRICEAKFGNLYLHENGELRHAAAHNVPPAFAELRRAGAFRPAPGAALASALNNREAMQEIDVAASQAYIERRPEVVAAVEIGGVRTAVLVPMVKDNEVVGIISIFRQEVRPFTDKQIALVKNFAAQAVIAIENTRLLNELRESLEQQTATADVLRAISSSPGELEPVFQAVLENAVRICDARFGNLLLTEQSGMRIVAMYNSPVGFVELRQRDPFIDLRRSFAGPLVTTKRVIHLEDLAAAEPHASSALAKIAGARTALAVPMLREDDLVGAITIYRQEVRPFTDKQIALVQNFAAQAVIAIENARLLNELRESLEQQTATSEVLGIISSSPDDLQPVFASILENATRICQAGFGFLVLPEGDAFRVGAMQNVPEGFAELRRREPVFYANPLLILTRVRKSKQLLHIPDLREDMSYKERDPIAVRFAESGRVRTLLAVPMLKEDEFIGIIVIFRQEVRPFTDKQIALVQNFAAQAVIAIDNARLLNELRQRTADLTESLEQQTATAEVLKIISSTPGELQPVFDVILENATRICQAKFGNLWLYQGNSFRIAGIFGDVPEWTEHRRQRPIVPADRNHPLGRTAATKQVQHVTDAKLEACYVDGDPTFVPLVDRACARSLVVVPMLREDVLLGAIAVYRREVSPFSDKQIELLKNFAAQAVIAIENARLLRELRQRSEDLSQSLENLRTTQDRLVQTQKLASLGQLTAGIAHEIKNPLNFVNNFSGVSVELIDELQETLGRVTADAKTRDEITELADTLRDNLDKIAQHGKRADAIVKNMLLHSREGSGEHRPVGVNALVEEALNLAYHGARAEKQGFNITLERSFDPTAGDADVYPQEISRVLINLISNGFYAATKRHEQAEGNGYEPTLRASTKDLGDRVEIRIRDNGTGIPAAVREKMFNPFFTTKPAGEGTGLGLSISHDIIVKQHAGSIEVDTEPGEFTEFRIILPRAGA
jgi:two-component system, NtrC family, sensor kinase